MHGRVQPSRSAENIKFHRFEPFLRSRGTAHFDVFEVIHKSPFTMHLKVDLILWLEVDDKVPRENRKILRRENVQLVIKLKYNNQWTVSFRLQFIRARNFLRNLFWFENLEVSLFLFTLKNVSKFRPPKQFLLSFRLSKKSLEIIVQFFGSFCARVSVGKIEPKPKRNSSVMSSCEISSQLLDSCSFIEVCFEQVLNLSRRFAEDQIQDLNQFVSCANPLPSKLFSLLPKILQGQKTMKFRQEGNKDSFYNERPSSTFLPPWSQNLHRFCNNRI